MLSNGRGAHGGSSAEWVVAALLAVYRDLRLFDAQQSQGIWRGKNTETLIGKRVVVLGAGDLAVNLASRLAPFEAEVTLVARRARPGVHALEDTDAPLAELTSGRLRAALDVTDPEPLPAGHPPWSAPGLLLTPHVAGSTAGAWERAWAVAIHQIEVFASGGRPPNLVAGPNAPT
jgi:phosphoglycerate dehydrogenase-like enzyme